MAVLPHGILGGVRNKVGGVVGYNSRGNDIVRAYAIPTNPNTELQKARRNLFKLVTETMHIVWNDAIKLIWDVMQSGKTATGWSRAIKVNLDAMADGFDYNKLVVVSGPRFTPVGVTGEYTGPTPIAKVEFIFPAAFLAQIKVTDLKHGLIVDTVNKKAYYKQFTPEEEDAGTILLQTGTPRENLKAFFWHTDSSGKISSPTQLVPIT